MLKRIWDIGSPPILYPMVLSKSGTRKSSVFNIVFQEHQASSVRKNKEYRKKKEAYLERKLQAEKQNETFKEEAPVNENSFISGDITPESIPKFLMNSGGHLIIADHEGNFFNVISGAYSREPLIDIFLKGYDKDNYNYVRKEESYLIEGASLSLVFMVQPGVLEKLVSKNAAFLYRGFLGRFMVVKPPFLPIKVKNKLKLDKIKLGKFYQLISFFEAMSLSEEIDFVLTAEAQKEYEDYCDYVSENLVKGKEFCDIDSNAAKSTGLLLRLALVFEIAYQFIQDKISKKTTLICMNDFELIISLDSIEKAKKYILVCLSDLRKIVNCGAASLDSKNITEYMKKNKLIYVTPRQLQRGMHIDTDQCTLALKILIESNVLQAAPKSLTKQDYYFVNPELHR